MGLATHRDADAAALANSSDELVERWRRGEDEAFRLILGRHLGPVLNFMFDMLGERMLAEELAQETFVRAYRNVGSLKDAEKLTAWLFGIARNVAREALYARGRQRRMVELDDAGAAEICDTAPRPDDNLLNKELHGVIRAALASLDEDKRLVFTLKVLHQRSYEEIAQITGSSVSKLKTDLHRAKAKIREQLRPYLRVNDEV